MYLFMAKYLQLDLSKITDVKGQIDESTSSVLTQDQLAVFNAEHPLPANAVIGDAGVMNLL